MLKLKDVLDVSVAHKIKIKDWYAGKVIWQGSKYGEGYEEMLEEFCDYEVVGIKAQTEGYARNNIKSILNIEVQRSSLEV